ncbi:histone deacetylase HDT1-like [Quillaja saponaria]|uniref:Histone deacetylase HDT1-like n=1 Tax=Quillaja saponaria TaxID=32244 RepID=A0AAD7QGY0_QUISA|nr:histone deacetylase HDT1-like [Quillaja saponaria]
MSTTMEFWGVEVRSGEILKVEDFDESYIHLSQATLGESDKNKGSEPVILNLKIDDQKLVLGNLSRDKIPQLSFDLVFEKEFELSHNWKHGSVYFCGYKVYAPEDTDDVEFTEDSEEENEDLPLNTKVNGKPKLNVEEAKPAAPKGNVANTGRLEKQVKVVKDNKEDEESDDEDEEESDDSDEEMGDATDDSDEGSDDDEDDEETPPKKAEQGKKRPNGSALKTPVSNKKAKSATPQKTDSKQGGHQATPYPLKKTGKTPANSEKSKDQTPKSGGQFSCKSCTKSFSSDGGLQQHSKVKHGQ